MTTAFFCPFAHVSPPRWPAVLLQSLVVSSPRRCHLYLVLTCQSDPHTCNDKVSEATTWQDVIGQPPPRGRSGTPPDTYQSRGSHVYEVSKYIHDNPDDTSSSNNIPLTSEELKVDKIALSWPFSTLSNSLRARLVVARPKSAREAWDLISNIVTKDDATMVGGLVRDMWHAKNSSLPFGLDFRKIFIANPFPPNHADDLPEGEPVQPDIAPVIPEHALLAHAHVLLDEDEDPKEGPEEEPE
ncbi:hypothetical protein Tco_0496467 [Tanacetum coccineum]